MSSPVPEPLYPYTPSAPLAIVAIVFYVLLTVLHASQMLRTRTLSNMGMVLGGIFGIVGFSARLQSSKDTLNKAASDIQMFMLVLGPSLLMFTVAWTQPVFFHVLRGETKGILPPSWRQTIYTTLNIVGFFVQVVGLALQATATTRTSAEVASKIVITAFVIQIIFWLFFFVERLVFHFRYSRTSQDAAREHMPRWKWWSMLFGLGIMIIFGRNLMRLTALWLGPTGFLSVNEWTTYAFDGYQMVVVIGAWGVFYVPGACARIERSGSARRDWNELGQLEESPVVPCGSAESLSQEV